MPLQMTGSFPNYIGPQRNDYSTITCIWTGLTKERSCDDIVASCHTRLVAESRNGEDIFVLFEMSCDLLHLLYNQK